MYYDLLTDNELSNSMIDLYVVFKISSEIFDFRKNSPAISVFLHMFPLLVKDALHSVMLHDV